MTATPFKSRSLISRKCAADMEVYICVGVQ